MTEQSPSPPPAPIVKSEELLRGGQEIIITHQGETYRLRITRNNKLILTK
jgi:hemin uptake protein HemP